MSNIRFYYTNVWDSQILEASSEELNYPAWNTQTRWKRQPWISTGDTTEYIRTSGSTGLTARAFYIFYHNITTAGTVTVQGSDDNWMSSTVIGTMIRTPGLLVYVAAADQTFDDFGFFVADSTNPDGFVKFGRAWIGVIDWEPKYGFSPKMIDPIQDHSLVMETTHGSISVLEKEQFQTWQMPFDCLEKSEYDEFFRAVGYHQSFVFQRKVAGYMGNDYQYPGDNSFYVSLERSNVVRMAGTKIKANMNIKEER